MQYRIHRKAGRVSIRFLDHSPVVLTEQDALSFAEHLVNVLSDEDYAESVVPFPNPCRDKSTFREMFVPDENGKSAFKIFLENGCQPPPLEKPE